MDDTRYPYTYAADLIRMIPDAKLSRSEASRIRQTIAKVIGMDDEELAKKLADYYKQRSNDFIRDLTAVYKDLTNEPVY